MAESQGRPYKRRLERHDISITVDVLDAVNDALVGRLVNIHKEGLMLVGKQQLLQSNLYQLELQMSSAINGRNKIYLGVDCLWSRSDNEGAMYWAGCKIIDISEEGLVDLENLIGLIS